MSTRDKQIPVVCPGHTRPLAELQYLQLENQETLLLSACHDKLPMVRHGTTGHWIGTWQGHKGAVWSVQMDPSGSLVATASGDYSARIWDGITGQSLVELPHKHIVKTCVFGGSKRLATGGKEGLLRVFDLEAVLLRKQSETKFEVKQEAAITKIICANLDDNATSRQWLCSCANGKIYTWKEESGADELQLLNTLDTGKGDEIRDMELLQTDAGLSMLTVAAGCFVYFFDFKTGQLLHSWKMPIHFRDEGGASLHPSGTKFVAGGSDLWIRVFEFATGKELECHKGHHGPIRCVRYSPDGKQYATGSEDGTIRLWQTDPSEEEPPANQ